MFVVDTNVLLYAADTSSPAHTRCFGLLEDWRTRAAAWCVTWPICYEFLRVATHPRVFRTPWTLVSAWQFIRALLASPALAVLTATSQHAEVLDEVVSSTPLLSGNVLHDVHTVALMREHGVRTIYTRDTDFHRFAGIEVVDPMAGSR
jgi:hypothetical protein